MIKIILRSVYILFIYIVLFSVLSPPISAYQWYKGNTHTHTTSSDGNTSPQLVAEWYRTHGYDFLAITDHNATTVNYDNLSTPTFLMMSGSELTYSYDHVTAIGISKWIKPGPFQSEIDGALADGGIPFINHPQWSSLTDAAFQSLKSIQHVEVANMMVAIARGITATVTYDETRWDNYLTNTGKSMYGVASDDAHTPAHFGKGWIVVRALSLSRDHIIDAIRKGNFYASYGPIISDIQTDLYAKTITIIPTTASKIEFIGKNGTILKTVNGSSAEYSIRGTELYIRGRVTNGSNQKAFTQPVFVSQFAQPIPTPIASAVCGTTYTSPGCVPQTGLYTVELTGAHNAVSVNFATYNLENNADDALNYPSYNAGNGVFKAVIDMANHPGSGHMRTNLWTKDAAGTNAWCTAIILPFCNTDTPTPTTQLPPTSTLTPSHTISIPSPTIQIVKPGDANGDNRVDGLDYVIWINHYGSSNPLGPTDGDFNQDRNVDGIDYVIWLMNYS